MQIKKLYCVISPRTTATQGSCSSNTQKQTKRKATTLENTQPVPKLPKLAKKPAVKQGQGRKLPNAPKTPLALARLA